MTTLKTRRRNLLLLALVVGLAATALFVFGPAARERTALEAIPDGAFLLVTIDLVRLRESPLAAELKSLHDLSDISDECGFDPIARAKSVAIGVPEKPDGVFGLAVTTDLAEDELVSCAGRVMGARSAMPRITRRGSWTEVEQEGILSERTRPKIAHRDGAPLLIARGDYLATMQATLDGTAKRAEVAAEHAALRKVALDHVGKDSLLVATAILPKSVRDKIKAEAPDEKNVTMAAILSVKTVSLAITAYGPALDIFAELGCETEAACSTVRDFLERKRTEIASRPAARFVGIGALLDATRLETHGAVLDLSLRAPASEIARAVRALLGSAFSPQPGPSSRPSLDFPPRDE